MGNETFVTTLLDKKVDLTLSDCEGRTVFEHCAMYPPVIETVKELMIEAEKEWKKTIKETEEEESTKGKEG